MQVTSETMLGSLVRCPIKFTWRLMSRSSRKRVLCGADWNTPRVDWIAFDYSELTLAQ